MRRAVFLPWPGLLFGALALAGLACGLASPPSTPTLPLPIIFSTLPASTPTAAHTPTAISAPAWLMEHIDQVSQDRLMGDVVALSTIPTRHVNSPGISIAAEHITRGFAEAGAMVEPDTFTLEFRGTTTDQRNIVASIEGYDPWAGAILLGAHYDSRTADIEDGVSLAPGANDNATGVAVLLEVARILVDHRPRATTYLVAFSAEETGLQGSRHFVEGGLPRQVRAMAAFDIVGNSSGAAGSNALRVFSAGPEESTSRRLAQWTADLAAQWTPELPLLVQNALDRPGRYSDHVPFAEAGVAAVRFIEDGEHTELQHNAFDTADGVDPAYLRRVAQMAVALAATLAEDPEGFLKE